MEVSSSGCSLSLDAFTTNWLNSPVSQSMFWRVVYFELPSRLMPVRYPAANSTSLPSSFPFLKPVTVRR